MSVFRKIGSSIQTAFKKAPEAISKTTPTLNGAYKKGSSLFQNAVHNLPNVSDTLGKVSQGLAKAAQVGTQVLESPAATAAAAYFGPQGLAAQMAARKVLSYAAKGSNLAAKGSSLSDISSYKKGADLATTLENLRDAQKRVGSINDAARAPSIEFA